MKRITDAAELLDGPLTDLPTLRDNLRDLARVNRWSGGFELSRRAIWAVAPEPPAAVRVLDVGTGAADIPVALLADARERVARLHAQGRTEARLYGANEHDGVGGTGSVFLLLDEPEVYGLPPDPRVGTADLPAMFKRSAISCKRSIFAKSLIFKR